MHREGRVMVLEPDDQADGQPVLAHRVDEAAAGLTVLARPAKRPAERVDHAVERARDLPHLLHAEAPDLRVHGAEAELLGERPCQMPLCPLAQHRGPGPDLDSRLVRGGRLPIAVEALVAGHDAADRAAVDEQHLGGRLGQHHRSELLRLLAQVAAELRQREDPVALVVEGRRRGQANAVARAHEVDGLAPDGAEAGQLVERRLREQVAQGRGVDDRAREQVGAGHPALVDDGDRRLAERLRGRGILGQELAEPDRARHSRRPAAHEEHADVDPLVLARLGRSDEFAHLDRGWIVGGAARHGGQDTLPRDATRRPPLRHRHAAYAGDAPGDGRGRGGRRRLGRRPHGDRARGRDGPHPGQGGGGLRPLGDDGKPGRGARPDAPRRRDPRPPDEPRGRPRAGRGVGPLRRAAQVARRRPRHARRRDARGGLARRERRPLRPPEPDLCREHRRRGGRAGGRARADPGHRHLRS